MGSISNMTSDQIKQKLIDLRYDPAGITDFAFNLLEEATNGEINIPDANNPFFFALETAALLASAGMEHDSDLMSGFYPKMSSSFSDVYRWMADADQANRFSTPSSLGITFIINADEVRQRAVRVASDSKDDIDSVYSKLVIPRNSTFHIAGEAFSLEYPVEMRVMKHGGFVVVYDVSEVTPYLSVETNQLNWYLKTVNGVQYLAITLPVRQLLVKPYITTATKSAGFKQSYSLEGKRFYAVRVFTRQHPDDPWVENTVTLSAYIYDNAVLTFVAEVLEDRVVVKMPEIYISNGMGVNVQVRVDVLVTSGALSIEPSVITGASIAAEWLDFNYANAKLDKFSAPLSLVAEKTMIVQGTLAGGSNGLTLAQLRQRVIYNTNVTSRPITPDQLEAFLYDRGYGVLKAEDLVTSLIYQATRALPVQRSNGALTLTGGRIGMTTAIGTGIVTTQASMEQLASFSTVKDNGNRITITPRALYEVTDGIYTLMSDTSLNTMIGLGNDGIAKRINAGLYLFSPFYYVLDANDDAFNVRIYDLDRPEISYSVFIAENNSVGVEIGSRTTALAKSDNGYQFSLVTNSGDYYKGLPDEDVACQMLFMPEGESSYAYLNGVVTGRTDDNERIWTFNINTNMDVTEKDALVLTSFGQFGNAPSRLRSLLQGDFTILTCIAVDKSPNDIVYGDSDSKLGKWYLTKDMVVVTEQKFRLQFGTALNTLYTRGRTVPSDIAYLRYTDDVPWRYSEDVYQRDAENRLVFDAAGDPVKIHSKGDVMVDSEGVPMIQYPKGSIKRDSNGKPIPVSQRAVLREFDVVGLDGAYYFTQNSIDNSYLVSTISEIVSWAVGDMIDINAQLLQQAKVRLRPKQTLGLIDVVANSKEARQIPAAIPFEVTFYMTDNGHKNASLRESLRSKVPFTIASEIDAETFSITKLVDAIDQYCTDDIVEIDVTPFGYAKDIKVVTMRDPSVRCAIKKGLDVASDGSLIVKEDVTINFLKHSDRKSIL